MSVHSPAWDELWSEARAADILDVAQRLGAQLKRAGPDWIGPCPAGCASVDGFVVTPKKHLFLCRPSGETGDAIDMCVHAAAMTKAEALEFVTGRDLPGKREASEEERTAREERERRRRAALELNARREAWAAEFKRRADEEAIAAVLERAQPLEGTHGEAYLRGRGIAVPKRMLRDCRFVRDLDYWGVEEAGSKTLAHLATVPAMIAIIRGAGGEAIGIHQTFLDPHEARKWTPIGATGNSAKKIRGQAKGGLIRLGMLGDKLVIAEGIESALSAFALGLGPEDASFAAAISLGNLAGKWTGTYAHPTRRGPDSKPTRYPNGKPDMASPGVILPGDVREVLIVADGDSERLATQGAVLTAGRRWRAEGRTVGVWWAPSGQDANDVVLRQAREARQAEQAHAEGIAA